VGSDHYQIGLPLFIAKYEAVAAVLDFAGQDGIQALEFCCYTGDLDRIALVKSCFVHLHEPNRSNMHLVDIAANRDHEVRTMLALMGQMLFFTSSTIPLKLVSREMSYSGTGSLEADFCRRIAARSAPRLPEA
jgi:hypothetical protein